MKDLLEAGVHFGTRPALESTDEEIHLHGAQRDLHHRPAEDAQCVQEARAAIERVVRGGGHVLFVGTKKQAKPIVVEEAARCGMYYVTERWLGGMLTNFKTIRTSVKRLHDLDRMATDGTFEKLAKKKCRGSRASACGSSSPSRASRRCRGCRRRSS